jgi:hypothetical protein
MSDTAQADLQDALQITIEMLDAAASGNWERVSQLDPERDRLLRKHQADALTAGDRETITALLTHNQTLMAHAEAAHEAVKQQLDQHQYNHNALRTYISSSVSR